MAYEIVIGRSEKDKLKFGLTGTVYLGKHYVQMGQTTSLSNDIYLDVASSHVVFVVGKRGSGKCVHGDTIVTLEDGSQEKIKNLHNRQEVILALDHDLKIRPAIQSEFFEREVDKILDIKLRSGKTIKLTPEHPLLTMKGWEEVGKLKVGSRIATPRVINSSGKKVLKDYEILLLAYLIAEGHTKKTTHFSNGDKILIEEFKKCIKLLHPDLLLHQYSKYNYKVSSRNIKQDVISHNILRDVLGRIEKGSSISFEKTPIRNFTEKYNLFGKGALEKEIPKELFTSTNEDLKLFLSRLFACDGSIYFTNNKWQVSYGSSSKILITQVQHLLLRFGVLSKLRNKNFDSFEIVISGVEVAKYINKIGFYGIKKLKAQKAINELSLKTFNTNVDTIPKELWDSYRPDTWVDMGQALNYSSPKSARSSINYSPSRQKLQLMSKVDERLKLIAKSDIFWDEIVEVNEILEKTTVYDISVPDMHNFIANDIIVHNSYTMGVIAEGFADLPTDIKSNLSIILLDTMGIYWTMKYPNKEDEKLLEKWNLKGKALDPVIFTPEGFYNKYKAEGIPTDFPFSVKPSELNGDDWCTTFSIDKFDPLGILIIKVINSLKETKENYDLDDILDLVKKQSNKNAVEAATNLFENASKWGLFSKEGTQLKDLAKPGQITVLDVSVYATMPNGWAIKSLVVGLISQKLFLERMSARKKEEYAKVKETMHYFSKDETKQEFPMVWLVIDEAHEFLPNKGKTLATDPLITILREGRQPGISLILASQQPGKIHTDVMTQSDTVIAHRITSKLDTDALGALMQSYMREGLDVILDGLPRIKGAAAIFDDTNEKLIPFQIRPRFTWHGGSAPYAIRKKEE